MWELTQPGTSQGDRCLQAGSRLRGEKSALLCPGTLPTARQCLLPQTILPAAGFGPVTLPASPLRQEPLGQHSPARGTQSPC